MKFRFTKELLIQAAAHAQERGMTLDEYIKEAAELAQEHQQNEEIKRNSNEDRD